MPSCPQLPGVPELHDHQRRVVSHFAETVRGVLVLHRTGTGKSVVAAACAVCILTHGAANSVYVITRKSVQHQISRTIKQHIIAANAVDRGWRTVVGTHQAIVQKGLPREPFFLVVDEAHAYMHEEGVRAQELRVWTRAASAVLLMTATPMSTGGRADVMALLRLLPDSTGAGSSADLEGEMRDLVRYATEPAARERRGAKCGRHNRWFELPDADAAGVRDTRHLNEAQLAHVARMLRVPPAYKEVYVCGGDSRMAFAGVDAKGRTQRRYKKSFARQQKQARDVRVMCHGMTPRLLNHLRHRLMQQPVSDVDMAVALLVQCNFRLMYGDSANYGLTTMLNRHVVDRGSRIVFTGKAGAVQRCELPVHLRHELRLLVNRTHGHDPDPEARVFPASVTAKAVLRRFKSLVEGMDRPDASGVQLSPKDVRTYGANAAFVEATRGRPPLAAAPFLQRAREIADAVKTAAEAIGTGPAVAADDYVCREFIACAQYAPLHYDLLSRSAATPPEAAHGLAVELLLNETRAPLRDLLRRTPVAVHNSTPEVSTQELLHAARGRVSIFYPIRHPDIAHVTTTVVKLPLSKPDAGAYDKLRHAEGEFRQNTLVLTASSHAKHEWIARKCLRWKEEQSLPVLVYCERLDPLRSCALELTSVGIDCQVLSGSSSAQERMDMVNGLHSRRLQVLLLSNAGAEGVDFVGVRHIVMLSLPWTFATYDQVCGRGARLRAHSHLPPSHRTVGIWPLLSTSDGEPTVDADIWATILRRKLQRDALVRELQSVSI
jgi:superfamily II DNA or RNA helicase/DNA topoisomerase IB